MIVQNLAKLGNNEDITEELSYSYTAKASVAEKIENDVTAIDEIEAGDAKYVIYNINGSRINSNPEGYHHQERQ